MSLSPDRVYRARNTEECKRFARAARARQGVKFTEVAGVLRVHLRHAARMFGEEGDGRQFTYADLFLLARAPETAGMVREMLTPLLELIDPRNLRLSDLEGLASSSTSAHTVLQILRPTVERLTPLSNVTSTAEVE